MVAYKKSAAAFTLASASLAAAQNATIIIGGNPAITNAPSVSASGIQISIGLEFTYTTTLMSLCPTGLVPVPYTITQHCPTGHCTQPPIPYGWQVTTKQCNVCGPKPTPIVVTECPYATPTPQPYCAECHHDIIVYPSAPACNTCKPEVITYTHVYPQPTPTPYVCNTCKPNTPVVTYPPIAPPPKVTIPPIVPPPKETYPPSVCTTCKPNPPVVTYPPVVPPPKSTDVKTISTITVPCTTCKPVVPATSQYIQECKTCALTVTVTAPCPTQPAVDVKTVTPVCPGPYCPKTVTTTVPCATCPPGTPIVPQTVKTQTYPPSATYPVCPGGPNCPATTPYSNVTIPKPPTYTGAAMKNGATGVFGLAMAVAAAAFL